jgi:predicted CoA-substrate-specific enzyme activase
MYRIGIDMGSVSVNLVVMDETGSIVREVYVRHMGRPFEVGKEAIEEAMKLYSVESITATGTAAQAFAPLVGASFVNEIVALTQGFSYLYPHVGSVIDIGGADSKLIIFEKGVRKNRLKVRDFSMNTLCAAGTGSFLDQQASRLRFTIEEFSEVALKSDNPPRIAGRCTVFAKSDMIHLQQIATPDYEIVAGLCYALARNFKSNIAKGKEIRNPVAFVGGVAQNAGMRKAIQDVFNLTNGNFIIPDHFTSMGAIGAVCTVKDDPSLKREITGFKELNRYLERTRVEETHEPLRVSDKNLRVSYTMREIDSKTKAYLGVDVGSISTNLVVIDEERNVLAKRYLMTEGRPLEAVKRGLREIAEEVGELVEIMGAGATGSGRYLTADFIGADIVRNEITAQAEAAISIDPNVDTIFEIGGQDSKYISIDRGVIVDFEMNKACAAGTGSFLEEQAEKLGISIKGEFGDLALASNQPIKMGERCTVFIESDIIHHQQKGAKTGDLVSGLSYSIVTNYLNKVVGDRRIGNRIFFQGGTAFNKGVVAAFEGVLAGRPIIVPPHHDVTGAIGAAILAMKEKSWEKSSFRGFDLSTRQYEIETFECKGCENLCEIRKVTVEREAALFYGSRCEKYDVVKKNRTKGDIPDLFKARNEIMYGLCDTNGGGETIGIPMLLSMHEFLPFWKTFLTTLGFSVVLSDPTNKGIIRDGGENIIVETCFPVKLAHGHILNLINKGVKRIFLPSVINMRTVSESVSNSFACPYAQSLPYTVKASIDFEGPGVMVDSPVIHLGGGKKAVLEELFAYGKSLHKSRKEITRAYEAAVKTQDEFYGRCLEKGIEALSNLKSDEKAMVVVGRPYNSTDPGANLNLNKKLIDLGVLPIPLDMLPIPNDVESGRGLESMYWGYGHKILRAAKFVRNHKNLYAIYITNFGCGPDSFITHFFKKTMKGKPYLQLEIDEHSADAGAVTRLEAFLDSIKNAKIEEEKKHQPREVYRMNGHRRKIYIPFMSDHAIALASAFRACGVDAAVMDESDEESVAIGRKYTTGKECYPCILTTGDMVKHATREDFDPSKSAFFMPSGGGPCRFGQYHRFHRMVLDEIGLTEVPIYAPNQDDRFYKELNIVGSKFSRLGWRGIVTSDLITKMLHETRAYEVNAGEADRVYLEARTAICDSLERGGEDTLQALEGAAKAFLGVKRKEAKKPVVGIVGEIYIRSNRFSNGYLVRKVEEFGGQVWLAPIAEWISYVNYTARSKSLKTASFSNALSVILTDYFQKREEHAMERVFHGMLEYGPEPAVRSIIGKANPYVDVSFEGEAILSVGKSIDFVDKGVSGIINAMPFTCMPGTISSAIMKLIQKKYDIPILNVAYDGQGVTNTNTRLDAFMYQVREHFQNNE